ncbi:hypothetical protein EDD66_1072 [Mobilisporobacter senegalensis]|uniref:Uncharacterized protein n=1 Tax=Mobilisporobacter senegalensis TaxID=1329262 RepID=A0A3N1XK39_9FIRM|nr:hypothetical protein [Mobilisporobacter senegalensis]ROR27089.1 hypothetical protein EDD66_1072 [Mobilisporobacter senegalensis]
MKSISLKKVCWVTLILVFALLYAPISLKVRAAETKEIKVSVVDDISLSTVTRGESSTDYNTVYSFTLDKTAIVKVSAEQSFYPSAGSAGVGCGVYTDSPGTALVKNGELGKLYEPTTITTWLEAGTYFIVFKVTDADCNKNENGVTSVGIYAEYIDRTATGNTSYVKAAKSKVYVVYNGKTYSATANSKGSFSIKTAKLTKGKKITAYAVKSGVKSKTSSVKVK